MKKALSIILTVALLLTALPLGIFGLTASAEETVSNALTEHVIIGDKAYNVLANENYTAYDAYVAAVSGKTETKDLAQAASVTFGATGWSFNAKSTSGDGTAAVGKYLKPGDYSQIAFHASKTGFAQYSVAMYNGRLFVNPCYEAMSKNANLPIELTFTAPKAGDVVIYDLTTKIAASANNESPFWCWLASDDNTDKYNEFTILKNGEVIWPLNGEDNKIQAGGESIVFPDLGAITVVEGDTVTLSVKGYGYRHGLYMSPAVAYLAPTEKTEEKFEFLEVGDSKYAIDANSTSDIYSDFKDVVGDLNTGVTFSGNWSMSARYRMVNNWNYNYQNKVIDYIYEGVKSDTTPGIQATGGGPRDWHQTSVVFYPNAEKVIVFPYNSTWDDANHKTPQIKLDYYAEKDGKVVLYDKTGVLTCATLNATPWWASENANNYVTIEIYKGSEKLWPLNGENNIVKYGANTIDFPDLGAIDVKKGDYFSIIFTASNANGRCGVVCNPTVSYLISDKPDTVTVGENEYYINTNESYGVYSEFAALTNGMAAETEVNFANSAWAMGYKYTNNMAFNKDPWNSDLVFKYRSPYNAGSGATVDLMGIQVDNYIAYNTWSNCFFTAAATFVPDSEKLYISPSSQCLKAYVEDSTLWGTAMKLSFNAYKDGSVVLFDKTGKFSGVGVAADPYWGNEGENAWVDIKIYKNDTVIWPTEGEAKIGKNTEIAFPDLGAIEVAEGDEISIVISGNPAYPDTRAGVFCSPVVAYTHTHEYLNSCDDKCDVCGYIREGAGHKYDNACDVDCNDCGEKREVAAHPYVENKVPATCTVDGSITYTCSICGDTYSEVIKAEGHVYDNVFDLDCNKCSEAREFGEGILTNTGDTLANGAVIYEALEGTAGTIVLDEDIQDFVLEFKYRDTFTGAVDPTPLAVTMRGGNYKLLIHEWAGTGAKSTSLRFADKTSTIFGGNGQFNIADDVWTDFRIVMVGQRYAIFKNDKLWNGGTLTEVTGGELALVFKSGYDKYVADMKLTPATEADICKVIDASFGDATFDGYFGVQNTAGTKWAYNSTYEGLTLSEHTWAEFNFASNIGNFVLSTDIRFPSVTATRGVQIYSTSGYSYIFRHDHFAVLDASNTVVDTIYHTTWDEAANNADGGYHNIEIAYFGGVETLYVDGEAAYTTVIDTELTTGTIKFKYMLANPDILSQKNLKLVSISADVTTIVDATCTANGSATVACTVCGDTYVQVIPATGHSYDNGCDVDCNTCGATREVGAHTYESVTTGATCTENGKTVHTCTECGYSYEEVIEAEGHKYASVTTDATCTENGKTVYTCSVCGDTYEEVIEAEGHKYISVVTDPTCEAEGYTTHTCDKCGDTYVDNKVAALGHAYDNACDIICNTCGDSRLVANTTELVTSNNKYIVLENKYYNAYSTFNALTSGLAVDTAVSFENSKWSINYKYTNDKDFGKDPWNSNIKFKYRSPYKVVAGNTVDDMGIQVDSYITYNTWSNCMFTGAVTYVPNGEKLYVSPSSACLQAENIDSSRWGTALKLAYTADETGKVVLWDTTGKFSGVGANQSPYWANEVDKAFVSIKIYKNDTLIWPTDGDAIISKTNTEIAFPELGAIDVVEGDEISIQFYGNPEAPDTRAGVFCNPVIAYVADVDGDGFEHNYDNDCDTDCNYCDNNREVGEHTYTSETFDATCTEDGKVVYTCTECGYTYEEAIKAEGHNYKPVVTDPDCENKGYTTYTCDKCGDSYVADYVDALGHKYTSETFDATCTEDGKVVYTCTTCGDTYEEAIKAEGHKYTTVVTDPTCEDKGYTTYTCDKCGDSYVADYVDALGHKYTTETFDATCTEDGKVVYTCTTCGDTYEEAIKAEGHKYESTYTPATFDADSYTTYKCSVCGDTYTETHTGTKLNAVAKIGDQRYQTVFEAFMATKAGDIVVLLQDVAMPAGDYYYVPSTDMTLDLNSFTFTVPFKTVTFVGENFKIMNGTFDGAGASYGLWIGKAGITTSNVVIENVTVLGGINVYNASSVTLKNCDVNADVEKSENDYYAVWADANASVVIESGTYIAADGKVAVNSAENGVVVKGGTFSSNVTTYCEAGKHTVADENGDYVYGEHSYTTETFDATCTEDGKIVYTCACGDTYEEAIKAEGHSYKPVVTDPDCENQGFTTHTCENCGDSYVDTYVDALGHDYSGEVTIAPTRTQKGEKTFTCANCGDTYTEEMDVLPQAIVENLGATTTTGNYYVYSLQNGKLTNVDGGFKLPMTMSFTAPTYETPVGETYYGQYYTDFYVKLDNLSASSYSADGCYLAGYYEAFDLWVQIPLDGFAIENGFAYPVLAIANQYFTYEMICEGVKSFTCGIYLSEEFLAANPDVQVSLNLGLTEEPVYDIMAPVEYFNVDDYTYVKEDLAVAPVASVNGIEFYDLAAAIAYANGETVVLLTDVEINDTIVIEAGETVVIDLAGKVITGTPNTLAAYQVILNKGNLTINDSVGDGAIVCDHKLAGSTSYAVNTITNCGTLTINGGEIKIVSTADYQIGYAIDNNSTTGNAVVEINGGKVSASGSYYFDGIRLFCNSLTIENSVTVNGGEVSTIWFQNPSDGAVKNTKDVKGEVVINGGKVDYFALEPSSGFNAAVNGGYVGNIEYFQTAEGRDLVEIIPGTSTATFGADVSDFCAEGYEAADADNDGIYEVIAHVHAYNTETFDATCTEDGKVVYTCACGDTYEEAIKATGHSYGDWIIDVPAKPGVAGSKHKECACGDTITESIPAVNELKFKATSLAIHNSIAIQYKVDAKFFTEYGYTNPYVVFTIGDNEIIVENYTYDEANGVYIFKLSPLAPYLMNDRIVATLYAELNGEVYTAVKKYSVVQYCVSQLSKHAGDPAYDELCSLLVDLLNYGSAAQIYVNHSENHLASDVLSDEWLEYATTSTKEYVNAKNFNANVIENATATFKAATLALKDSVTIIFRFELAEGETLDGITVRFEAIGRTWNIAAENFVFDEETGRYSVEFGKLNASQMAEIVSATICKDGVAISNTATYSIESYAFSSSIALSEELANLVDAMLKYGESAKAFVTP